ncbi:hypothetical protein MP638_001634 [Amoeboaphelidium occidentale]|nr:hypothetical protein MP638_001634 [Amoeboaphelidium occidentale]
MLLVILWVNCYLFYFAFTLSLSSSSTDSSLENMQQGDDEGRDGSAKMTVGYEKYHSAFPLKKLRDLYLPDDDSTYRWAKVNQDVMVFSPQSGYPPVKHLPPSQKKRILVTGGAGFVGSHLVDRLMLMGHDVIVLDNFFTGNKDNVMHWIGHPNFELVRHDVVDPFLAEVDQIYHLACPASPPHYQYNPIKTVKTSVVGTINMLGLAKRVKARFLLTSTSEVYGDPEEHPQKETYWGHVNPIGPRACYDEGKRVAETLTYAYEKQDGVEVRVARIFNTFGPRMNAEDGRVVSNFIMQALTGSNITVYGDGKQTRSFQYVHDLVDGLIALMNAEYNQPVNIGNPDEYTIQQFADMIRKEYVHDLVDGLIALMNAEYNQPVNIGNPDEYTIQQFAEMIRKEVNPDAVITHLPATTDDPQKRQPDISRAREILGWKPKFDVKTGIAETVEYFKKFLNQNKEF